MAGLMLISSRRTRSRTARPRVTRRGRLALACVVVAAAPVSPALAQGLTPSALPGALLGSVSEAGGQLFWTGPIDRAKISLYTRPAAGGATRLLGTLPGPGSGTDGYVAFDGDRYAVSLYREVVLEEERPDVDEEDCGVCESDVSLDQQVIAGTLGGAPKTVFRCTTTSDRDGPVPEIAVAGGRTFLAGLACNAPAGVLTVSAAGALTSFDAAGSPPLAGAGNWLTYAGKDATKVVDLAGGGSYTVPVATNPSTTTLLGQALLLQSDGSIVRSGGFVRTGGTTPPVPLRVKWDFMPETLFAGDRLFYRYGDQDLAQLPLTSGQGPRAIVAAGLAVKRALQLNGSTLDVAAYSCTGAVRVQSLDLDAGAPAVAVNGCPVRVTTRALRLTTKRTITVAVRCANGCSGTLTLQTGDLALAGKLKAQSAGTATARFRVPKKQLKAVRRSATFAAGSAWLTVDARKHRLNRPR